MGQVTNEMAMLAQRLKESVERAGGASAVARRSSVSRAQLARYLGGAPVPSDRLVELAEVLGVSSGWLLGETTATRIRIDTQLDMTRQMAERLLRQLQRFTVARAFLPNEIARMLELMVMSQHHMTEKLGKEWPYSDFDLELGLQVMNNIRINDWLDVYVDGCRYLMHHGLVSLDPEWANKWVMIVQELFKRQYQLETYVPDYYARLNAALPEGSVNLKVMQDWTKTLIETFGTKMPIRILDAGCGNGRHLVYLHQASALFDLKGIDVAPAAKTFCTDHEKTGRLKPGTFEAIDFLDLPYEKASFDAYMCITTLQFLPLIPNNYDTGVGRALAEAVRVLKPQGMALLMIRSVSPDEFYPYFQCSHPPKLLSEMIEKLGCKVVKREPYTLRNRMEPGSQTGRGTFYQDAWVFQKL